MSYDAWKADDEHTRLDECELDEAPCIQCHALKAQLDLVRAELASTRCCACGGPLPIRSVQIGEGGITRSYCSSRCWVDEDTRERRVVP